MEVQRAPVAALIWWNAIPVAPEAVLAPAQAVRQESDMTVGHMLWPDTVLRQAYVTLRLSQDAYEQNSRVLPALILVASGSQVLYSAI
jgi:hypothetical protein